LQLVAKYATAVHQGRARSAIILDDPTVGAGRAALLWAQAALAGACDAVSTLSQTCLQAARVARGDACVARVVSDDAVAAARACLDRLSGAKTPLIFFGGLELHARKEADILAKASDPSEKVLAKRFRGPFKVSLPECTQEGLRWAARLAIAIAHEVNAAETRVFLVFWAGPGCAGRVWRDAVAQINHGEAGRALAATAARAAATGLRAPGPFAGALARACADAASSLCRSATQDVEALASLATCFAAYSGRDAQHAAAELVVAARRARVASDAPVWSQACLEAETAALHVLKDPPDAAWADEALGPGALPVADALASVFAGDLLRAFERRDDMEDADDDRDGRDVLVRRALTGEGDGAVCAKATLLKLVQAGPLREALLVSHARAETSEGVAFALQGAAYDAAAATRVLASLPPKTSNVDVARLHAAALGAAPARSTILEVLTTVRDEATAVACAHAAPCPRPQDACAWLEGASSRHHFACALAVTARTSSHGDEALKDRALTALADGDEPLSLTLETAADGIRVLKALSALSQYAASRGCPPDDLRRLGLRLRAPEAFAKLLAEASLQGLSEHFTHACGFKGAACRAALGTNVGAHVAFLHERLKRRLDEAQKAKNLKTLTNATRILGLLATDPEPTSLRAWALSELARAWACGGLGAGAAYAQLRKPSVVQRLRSLVFASKDLDDAQHAEVARVITETAGVKNSVFDALSALIDDGASQFTGSAPSVVAQAVAPSLVVRRETATLEALFGSRRALLEACLPRCLCAALLQIRSVPADAGNRLLADVASLAAFASGVCLSTPPVPRAKEDLLRSHADAVLVLLAAELGGDRAAAARDALDVVGHAVFGSRASGVSRRKKQGNQDEALATFVGRRFVHLVHAVVVHRAGIAWERADRSERAARLRALASCAELLSPNDAATHAPKVLGILGAALEDASDSDAAAETLAAVAVDALDRFAQLLPDDALRAHLAAIVVAASPSSRKGVPRARCKRAQTLLRRLLVERRDDLESAMASIPTLPDTIEGLNMNVRSLRQELTRLAQVLEAEAPAVRVAAAEALASTLSSRHAELAQLLTTDDDVSTVPPEVADVASALLRAAASLGASKEEASSERFRLAVATALGELGALDPTRLDVALHKTADEAASRCSVAVGNSQKAEDADMLGPLRIEDIRSPPWGEDAEAEDRVPSPRDRLVVAVVAEHLVSALHGDKVEDKAAYGIQELLRLLAGDAEDAKKKLPKWARKAFESRNVHDLVAPYASTDYVMKGKAKIRDHVHTNAERYGDDARQWAVRLAWDLCLRACSGTHAPVFRICRPMLTRCDSLAPFLLPYLVADVACTGGLSGEAFVAKELASAVDVGRDPVILQLVFDLRSTMERWRDACSRLEQENKKAPSHRGRLQEPFGLRCFTHETTQRQGLATGKFTSILEALPHCRLADAAARAHADARAVLSYELDAKATHEKWRKRQPKGKDYGDGADGWLPRLDPRSLERLQKVGARVAEDPDFLSGLAAVRRKAQFRATLSQDIREAETRGDWRRALDGYEHVLRAHEEDHMNDEEEFPLGGDQIKIHEGAAAIRCSMPKAQAARGLLQCLLELGHGESALLHADGFVARDPLLKEVVAPWQAEAAMQLGRWEKIPTSASSESRVALAACVAALRTASSDRETFLVAAKKAKLAAMAGLGAASMESYGRAYPFVARLHAVREVEHARELIGKEGDLLSLERRWDARRKAGAASSVPSWLAVQRRCLEVCGAPLKAGAACLLAATLARKAGRLTVARGDLRDAARLGVDMEALSLAEAKVARAAGQRGASRFGGSTLRSDAIATAANHAYKLLEPIEANVSMIARRFGIQRVLDDCHGPMNILDVLERNGPSPMPQNSGDRVHAAKRLLQATDCVVDARLRHGEEVIRRYELCVALRPDWARAYLSLARYFDLLATAREKDVVLEEDEVLHVYARRAMQWYARGLEHSAKHAQAALPRLVTMWFAYAAMGDDANYEETSQHPTPKKTDKSSLRRLQAHADETIRRAAKKIPATVWYGVMAQLISHAAHTRKQINTGVTQLLARVVQVHPDQALWTITYLATSTNEKRRKTGENVFDLAITRLTTQAQKFRKEKATQKEQSYKHAAVTLDTARKVFKEFARLARNMPIESRKIVKLSKFVNAEQAQGLLVPARVALTPVPRRSSKGAWPAFPDRAPRISRLSDDVEVLRSKARPKKIALDASDGTRMRLLCKCEKAGDLRKDARVQGFNGVVNRLLDRDAASRRRGLRLRTFAVVILDEECGLLEWVPRTRKLKQVVDAAYRLHPSGAKKLPQFHSERVSGPFKQAQTQHRNDAQQMAKVYRQNVLSLYEPCTSRWFVSRFASDPAQWLQARAAFVKSCATWGAVGHTLGLGDRHGENILIDMDSGGCVHVDFDCLFDKGCALKEPEIVPFRLTPHMVEAFGCAGVDGAFKTALQLTLGTLRDHKETLLHVLEPFLRDTTVAWERPGKAQAEEGSEPPPKKRKGEKQDAAATLKVVSQRLDGIYNVPVPPPPGSTQSRDARAAARGGCSAPDELPLSVPGQVERLIKESTSDLNLCRMYLGWTPFL